MNVKLIAYTPNAELLCAKAMRGCRTSELAYRLNLNGEYVKHLIRLAKKLGHLDVLEHASFTFSVAKISRSCSHQLVRHRIATFSQQSMRSVDMSDLTPANFVVPETVKKDPVASATFYETLEKCLKSYKTMRQRGIPKEDARFILPIASPTNITFTMNARELLHFFKLRLSTDAQWEIRNLAKEMLKLVKEIAPTIFEDVKG